MTLAKSTLVVGGYTASGDGNALGICGYRIEPSRDKVDVVELPTLQLDSPSYLIAHPNKPWCYAVTEADASLITQFAVEADGLRRMSSTPTGAAGACHLAVTSDGNYLVVAHYVAGLVTSHRIGPNGAPGPVLDTHRFSGSGPNPQRQSMAHAHQVVAFGDEILVVDLGSDRIHRLSIDDAGAFTPAGAPIELPAGSGPRHLVADGPDRLIVACELSAEVLVVRRDGDNWQVRDRVSSTTSSRHCQPSAIRLRGDDVFVANRGPDTFAVLDLDREADSLALLTEVPTGGRWPRDLVVDGDAVWIACERSDVISVFRDVEQLDAELGAGTDGIEWRLDFQLASPSPTCVLVLDQ